MKKVRFICLILALVSCLTIFGACKKEFNKSIDLRVMSFNIRVAERDERRAHVIKCIQDESPDVVGVQESDGAFNYDIEHGLTNYAYTGNKTAIFYRSDKFDLIQSGTKYMSFTPDYFSRLEGSGEEREFTYAKLKDKTTGVVFVHINTHLDFGEVQKGQTDIVSEYAKIFSDYPTFITGDFNNYPESTPYNLLINEGYVDSSDGFNPIGTFNNYNDDETKHTRIDYIFSTPKSVNVNNYTTCNYGAENGGGYMGFISDHYAIYIDCKVTNKDKPKTTENTVNSTIFKVGEKMYGDVSFNLHFGDGIVSAFQNDVLYIKVEKGKQLVLESLQTADNVRVYLWGEGSIIINGDVKTNTLIKEDTVNVTINGTVTENTPSA